MPPHAGGTSLTRHCAVLAWFPRELIGAVTRSQTKRGCGQKEVDAAHEGMLDPIAGSSPTRKSMAGINNLFADDLFGTGGTEMEQHVLARLLKRFPSWFRRLE